MLDLNNGGKNQIDLGNEYSQNTKDFLTTLDYENMNDLEKFFYEENHKLFLKWKHYFEIYDRHFSKFRGKEVTIVEIGVYKGGSLQMWKKYFGPKCKIIGIDIDESCRSLEEEQIEIMIGSQEDVNFLETLKAKVPKIDILIDDGGHTMNQQKTTFEQLFNNVSEDGVYLCEDLHTSYWGGFGGGYKNPQSYIEYSKDFIDYINAWHSQDGALNVNEFTRSVHSLHYYDSILVIEKRKINEPMSVTSK